MAKIILNNSAEIDLDGKYLEDFISYANMPQGDISLLLHDNSLPEKNQGVCVPSRLIKFAPKYSEICPCLSSTNWDCCIAIAEKWCISRNVFPAYFTYLLGHEFGHAYICLSDIALHIHCCLINDWIIYAPKNVIQFPHNWPAEQLFDRFGKYLSFKMHGDEKLDHEINTLKESVGDIEKQHLEMIQNLSPTEKFEGLRNSIIKDSRPYRDEMIRYWKNDFEEDGSNSLASLILDYDELFEY